MSVHVNKEGKLVIEIESRCTISELVQYRKAIYDLIGERNEEFTSNEPVYFGIELLRQMEPSEEQLKKALMPD